MADAPLFFRRHRLRQLHLGLLVRLMDAVQDVLGRVEVRRAAERFFRTPFASGEALAEFLGEREAHGQFLPWLLWDAPMRRGRLGARLLPSRGLQPDELALVTALAAASPDVYRVESLQGSTAILIRLHDEATLEIFEPVLSTVAQPGELLLARALEIADPDGAIWLLDAVHLVLPSACLRPMVAAAKAAVIASRESRQPALLDASIRALKRRRRRVRGLPAPDGEPMVRVSVTFDLAMARQLRPALAELTAAGRLLRRRDNAWVVADPELGAVGAQLIWRGDRLLATTRSLARADRLRRALSHALPGLRPRLTLVRDVSALLEDESDGEDLARLTRDWLAEYLHGLEHRPLSALNGATPLQAMTTARGRTQVRALLRQLEPLTQVGGPQCRSTLDAFWQGLRAGPGRRGS